MCRKQALHGILGAFQIKTMGDLRTIDTEILKIDPIQPDPFLIDRAASLLRSRQVVVFPTETVYGLGADAFQPAALEQIFAAKGRPYSDPLIVHIADLSMLEQLTVELPVHARDLVQAFWPGPLTIVVPRSPRVPDRVTAGLQTVAIRMPRHPVALALIRAASTPIAAPSANRFMHVSPTTAQHVMEDLGGRVPLILDGGPSEVGVESTVLDLCSTIPTILRPGGLSLEALRSVLPNVQPPLKPLTGAEDTLAEQASQQSPGQMLTHYAPTIPLLLFDGSVENMRLAMLAEVRIRVAQGVRVGVLVADEDVPFFQNSGAVIQSLGTAAAPEEVAAALFASLRTLEGAHVQVILCRNFDEHGLGLAVRDRLLKAAGGRIFKQGF